MPRGTWAGRLFAVLAAVVLAAQSGCLRREVADHAGECKT
jgi:hypothetical protein